MLGTAGFVGGRTVGGGAYLGVAVASTYLIFAGMVASAAFAFIAARRARHPVYTQVAGFALFLDGALLVGYGFNRGEAVAGSVLLGVVLVSGSLAWRDLVATWNDRGGPSSLSPSLRVSRSALWIPVAAATAVYFALGEFSPTSSYWSRWLAVAAVLVAVVGRTYRWAATAAALLIAGYGLWIAFLTARPAYVIAALIVSALSALQLTRRPRFDPVHLIAVQLSVALAMRWAFYLGSGLGLDPNTYGPGTTATPFRAELPLLAMALAAIGLGIHRPLTQAAGRLGLAVPRWWHVVLALALADGYVLLAYPVNIVTYSVQPTAYYEIGEILRKTDASLPYWAFAAYALLAGISEESLFRGAIQPRVGILGTAVLFAMIHVQYGLTPVLALVFTAGLAYGFVRRYINLTTAVIAHAATDTGGFLLAHDLRTKLLWTAVIVFVVAVEVWRRRRKPVPGSGLYPGADRC